MSVHEVGTGMFGLFPENDFSLLVVVLGMPLLGALVNGLWGKKLGKQAVTLMTLSAVGISFMAAIATFIALARVAASHAEQHVVLRWTAWSWMHANGLRENYVPIEVRFSVDALSGVMMLVITGVGLLIHLYSTSYMATDKGYSRFFAVLNLFIFSMLVLVLGDNLPVLFVGWEGVGLCSYLLIGFWYENMPNAQAGKKAFVANRIGDFGLLCAMFLFVHYAGALDWVGISNGSLSLINPNEAQQIHIWPIGGGQYTGALSWLQPKIPLTISPATAVGLALLLGAAGKSAQIPLYVWLPDAMAGPTPVSALIHAATMVTAGIYLICRLSFVFVLSPFVMMLVACIGAATALFAATIALVQNDIKKVLAYSTISQLGFMFLGVGAGAFTAGFFHVFTHAFFKACLFLGSGSVIHAMHVHLHDDAEAQDMRNMGGLRRFMPITYVTFLAATAAIVGFPLTSGFFSKDEILTKTFLNHVTNPLRARGLIMFEPPMWLGPVLYSVGVLAAAMTAFYMCRLLFLTFWGEFRGWKIAGSTDAAAHADDAHGGHDEHGGHGGHAGASPHESPWQMTLPLIVLAAASLFAGALNMDPFHITPMEHWLAPVFESRIADAVTLKEGAEHLEIPLALGGVAAFLVGTSIAYWMYVARRGEPARAIALAVPRLHRLVLDKWRIDELYNATIIAAVDSLAETSAAFDKWVVDGIFGRLSGLVVAGFGSTLRAFQNGVVHAYAAVMVIGMVAIGWFVVKPHAEVNVTEASGDYVVEAAQGLGYAYRWDADGNGQPDQPAFDNRAAVRVHLEPGESKIVRVEVTNSFGFHGQKEVSLKRGEAAKTLEVVQQ